MKSLKDSEENIHTFQGQDERKWEDPTLVNVAKEEKAMVAVPAMLSTCTEDADPQTLNVPVHPHRSGSPNATNFIDDSGRRHHPSYPIKPNKSASHDYSIWHREL